MRIPLRLHRLVAPNPGWSIETDVLIVGSGIAGLYLALQLHAAGVGRVLIATKANLSDGSTRWAQGGVAAVLGSGDTPEDHLRDTMEAGDGLCDRDAVSTLVHAGTEAVRRLILLGTRFDRDANGKFELTREGGHRKLRIVHATGDATGAEIMRSLEAAVRKTGIRIIEHALAIDLLKDAEGRACGVTLHVMGEGSLDGTGEIRAGTVVLATGGMGQVFAQTTNPRVATGDGVALGFRAGASVADIEFIQFHPTVFAGSSDMGQQPLISEAVRGEGAYLRNHAGERFMLPLHELSELAPRDVVAKAIMGQMLSSGQPHMWLDATHFGGAKWQERFPGILRVCRGLGVDPVTDWIPIAPAAHYASGGLRTDLHGRTTVPGLYACGEVACTGVHGANRLASNSLLEGLVFAERIAAVVSRETSLCGSPVAWQGPTLLLSAATRHEISSAMSRGVGVLRSRNSLEAALDDLAAAVANQDAMPSTETWEATNLATVALLVCEAARAREETRGGHWRSDYPQRQDAAWRVHQLFTLTEQGVVATQEAVR